MIRISATNLQVKYDRHVALQIPELEISGTILAVLGHNGAGKSTLLKTLLGLLIPQKGKVVAEDQAGVRLLPELHMAFCPENGAVFEDIKVSDYLNVWLRISGKRDKLSSARVAHLLDLFEVDPLLLKLGRELSKGQRRRVQSVVGFLIEPKLFLFDEPFDGLDVQRTAELSKILESFKDQTAFIISSHRMDVIERLADSGIVLAQGGVVAKGKIVELSSQLAGKSVIASQIPKDAVNELSVHFSAYQTHIGEQIVLTGPSISSSAVNDFLKQKGLVEIEAREFVPTLTDAMGYHLQVMRNVK